MSPLFKVGYLSNVQSRQQLGEVHNICSCFMIKQLYWTLTLIVLVIYASFDGLNQKLRQIQISFIFSV